MGTTLIVGMALAVGISPTLPAAATVPCADVLFIGVRGSGQSSGFGEQIEDLLRGVTSAFTRAGEAPSMQTHAVDYTSAPVQVLAQVGGLSRYEASINEGMVELDRVLDEAAVECPGQALILAGYSQGAMAVQQYLGSSAAEASTRSRVAGVGLIASGDREKPPAWIAVETGTAPDGSGVRTVLGQRNPPDLPTDLRGRVLSLCDRNDPVCHIVGALKQLNKPLTNLNTHINGYQRAKAADLGADLGRLALGVAYPRVPTDAYTVTYGQPASVTLPVARFASDVTVTWRLDGGALPPGLTLDPATGAIRGTPTFSGTYTAHVSVEGRTWQVWLPTTVKFYVPGVVVDPPPPPPPPPGSVTVDFSGTVTAVGQGTAEGSEPVPVLPPDIQVGTPVTGAYTFRPDTPDTHWDTTDAMYGVYRYTEAPYGATMSVGSLTYSTTYPVQPSWEPFSIATSDTPWGDAFQWSVLFPSASNGVPVLDFGWASYGPPTALLSDALPGGPISLSSFESTTVRVTGCADEVFNGDWGCATSGYGMEIAITSTSTRP